MLQILVKSCNRNGSPRRPYVVIHKLKKAEGFWSFSRTQITLQDFLDLENVILNFKDFPRSVTTLITTCFNQILNSTLPKIK